MKPDIRTYPPPSMTPAFNTSLDYAQHRAEAGTAIRALYLALEEARAIDRALYLALEEARAIDEHGIGYETNKLVLFWNTMTHSPDDHLTILRIWKSFRMPMMVDGCSVVYEQAVEAMEAFLRG